MICPPGRQLDDDAFDALNHYEVLGVIPGASLEEIVRAYRARILKEHPDKGGRAQRFRRVQQAFDVLKDPDARRAYDRSLKEDSKILVQAPVNVGACLRFAKKLALWKIFHGAESYGHILIQVAASAVDGFVENAFAEASSFATLGIKGALEVTMEPELVGPQTSLSVFALAKVLRSIARTGLKNVHVADICNSHFQHMLRGLLEGDPPCPVLRRIVDDREGVFTELKKLTGLARDEIKTLLLTIAYGGSVQKHCSVQPPPQLLLDLSAEVRALARARRQQMPELYEKVVGMGKRDPEISMLSYLNGAAQRQTVELMLTALPAGAKVFSYERDGFVWQGPPVSHDRFEAVNGGVPVEVSSYPTEAEIEQGFRKRYPHLDWDMESFGEPRDLMWAWINARAALEVEDKLPKNHSDFATVVAAELEPFVYILDSTAEYYDRSDCEHGAWTIIPKERVKAICRAVLLNVFRKKSYNSVDGKMKAVHYYGAQPWACKTTALQNNIIAQVLPMLTRPHPLPLNSDSTRRYLADASGCVYDFVTDSFITSPVDLRIGKRLVWSFGAGSPDGVWQADGKRRAEEVMGKIYDFLWGQAEIKTASLEEDPVFGKPLADALRAAATPVLRLLLDLFDGNADEALYMINMAASFACAWQNRCEFAYMFGPGNSGKDTFHNLMTSFFGGYAAILPQRYFVVQGNRDPEAPTSVLDSVRAARYIGNNEIPAHKEFNSDMIKALVEQKGTGMVSRSMRRNATQWNPMAGVVLTSNHPICISDAEREATSGTARRLVAIKMPRVFEISAGEDVKDAVLAGRFNAELFHWARLAYQHLRKLAGFKRVYPQPPRFLMDTTALLEGSLHSRIQEWLERNTEPQRTYDQGTTQKTVREALAEVFELDARAVGSLAAAAGLVEKRSGSARVYLYEYPSEPRARVVRLKERAEWA